MLVLRVLVEGDDSFRSRFGSEHVSEDRSWAILVALLMSSTSKQAQVICLWV